MAFGKRTPGTHTARSTTRLPRTPDDTAGATQYNRDMRAHSAPGNYVWHILCGVAIGFSLCILGVMGLHFFTVRAMMKTIESTWEGPAGFASFKRHPEQFTDLERDVRAKCPAPKFGFRLPPAKHPMDRMEHALYSRVMDAKAAAEYIRCSTGVGIERFCNDQARRDLADHVRGYLSLRTRALDLAARESTRPQTRFQAIRSRIQASDPLFKKVIIGRDPIEKVDPLIVERLQWFIEHGYFDRWDFGGVFYPAVPGELADSLANVKQRTDLCAS